MPPRKVDASLAAELLASPLKYIMLDIDGVLWTGAHTIPRIPETLQFLRQQGKELRFLSNNASVSRAQLLANFDKHGVTGVKASEVYNSAYAAALKLKSLLGEQREGETEPLVHGNVFVVGEEGLCEEIKAVLAPGFVTYGPEVGDAEECGGYNSSHWVRAWEEPLLPPPRDRLVLCNGNSCRAVRATGDPAVDKENSVSLRDLRCVAVVAGLDLHFNMVKLGLASMVLQGEPADGDGSGCGPALFVATNEDPSIPVGERATLFPGAGVMISSLAMVCGRGPDAVCGKPRVDMATVLFERERIANPSIECLMVGDRLTTDVAFGNNAGCQSMLVLSGAEGEADVQRAEDANDTALIPHFIAPSLACFLPS